MVSPLFACNVCHSKNPKMVRMHTELDTKIALPAICPAKGNHLRNEPAEGKRRKSAYDVIRNDLRIEDVSCALFLLL